MMRVRFLLSLTLAMLLTVGVAYAQRGKVSKKSTTKPTAVTFDAKDMNKDGKLSWDEFRGTETAPGAVANLKIIFQAMDVNKDGMITPEEYAAYHFQKLVNGTYDAKNINKSGRMTWEEYRGNDVSPMVSARLRYEFQTMDTNKDNVITPEEFATYHIRMALEGTYNSRDVNKDGKLSWEEFQGRETNPAIVAKLKDIFRAMDVNEDGVVTIEKFHAYWTKPMSHDQNQNQNMYQNINKNMNQKIKSKP